MSFSTSKPVACQLLPLTGPNGSHVKVPSSVVMAKSSDLPPPASQLNTKEEKLELKAVSRREMVSLAGISLASVSLSLAGPAEARATRAEMKNKILEKLKELRERFGLTKQKDESGEQTSSPEKDQEVEEKTSENDGREKKSTPQTENIGEEKNSAPQQESEGGEKKSTPTPENEGGEKYTPPPEDEGGDKSPKQESRGGETKSTPEKDESSLLPFLNLTEVEAEPLAEATLPQ